MGTEKERERNVDLFYSSMDSPVEPYICPNDGGLNPQPWPRGRCSNPPSSSAGACGSFLKVGYNVESETMSMNLSFSVTVKATALSCTLGLLPACDSGMACVGHSENIDSVSYADLHADTFPRMIKKSTH